LRLRPWLAAGLLAALVSGCGSAAAPQRPTKAPAQSTPPVLGSLDSSGAGNRFYEIYDPVGAPRGTVLLIHGGGWQDDRGKQSPRYYDATLALTLRAEGWRVVNIGYTQGYRPTGAPDPTPMLRDVVAFYDQIRSAFGGPVCADGQSAGGHLAAMLAVERPTLTCAVLDAAPTDLPSLLPKSNAQNFIKGTFGTDPSTLAHWSPARDWRSTIHTPVYATFAANDPTVPPQQGAIFKGADPKANVDTVPGGTFYWLHSLVNYNSLFSRDLTGLVAWLKREMPAATGTTAAAATDAGGACAVEPLSGQRYRLMLAGDAWQQQSTWTVGQPTLIAATRGCSGSSDWQDDGLSLWAWSSGTALLPQGQGASLTLAPGHTISRLSVSFRGFLARPQDWNLGLYASTGQSGPVSTPVATCDRGNCSGLGLFRISSGSLLVASGSTNDPDRSAQAPSASFTLPAGTVRVAWTLQCVAPGGCPVQSMAQPRPRDPLGQRAIFSIYSADVR
jgi:acetyl esterase/lipase